MTYLDYLAQALIALRKAKEAAEQPVRISSFQYMDEWGRRTSNSRKTELIADRIAEFESDLEKYYQFLGSI